MTSARPTAYQERGRRSSPSWASSGTTSTWTSAVRSWWAFAPTPTSGRWCGSADSSGVAPTMTAMEWRRCRATAVGAIQPQQRRERRVAVRGARRRAGELRDVRERERRFTAQAERERRAEAQPEAGRRVAAEPVRRRQVAGRRAAARPGTVVAVDTMVAVEVITLGDSVAVARVSSRRSFGSRLMEVRPATKIPFVGAQGATARRSSSACVPTSVRSIPAAGSTWYPR